MSHRKPVYDTQQGASRTRDATVARNTRIPTSRYDARQQGEASRPNAKTQQISPSPPLIRGDSLDPADRLGQRSVPMPRQATRNLTPRSTSTSKNVHSTVPVSRPTTRPESTSQEVPLLMESYPQGTSRREQASGRSLVRAVDPSDDMQSSLDIDQDAIFGIVMPRAAKTVRATNLPPRLIPELQALAASSTRLPQSSNRSLSTVSSPSTKFSSSPSPWSVSTTATTPTSWSSTSPAIVQQVTGPAKRSQTVPFPASKRERIPKMPALPESLQPHVESEWPTGFMEATRSSIKTKSPFHTPAPTPPPRTSSAKHSLSRSSSKSDKRRATPRQEPTTSSSDLERSPLARRSRLEFGTVGESIQHGTLTRAHNNLQQSLGDLPRRNTTRKDAERQNPRTAPADFTQPSPATRAPLTAVSRTERSLRPSGESIQRQERFPPKTPEPAEVKVQSSPGRSAKLSRLGLFGRRSKSPAAEVERSPRKLQRKGPIAGTGHEGYGRYGRRGRKTSQENTTAGGSESERSVSSSRRVPLFSSKSKDSRSTSRANRSSQSDLDDFAATRLKPVPIVGGSGNSLQSSSASQLDVYSISAPAAPVFDRWGTPSQSQTSLGQQSFQDTSPDSRKQYSPRGRVPTLAVRRSQRFGNETDTFNLPTPIRTEGLSAPVYINSQDDSRSSTFPASTPSTTTDPNRGDAPIQKPREKKSRRLRWNLFRRKGTEPEPERPVGLPSSCPEEMSVSVSAIPVSRSMPYYAVMDSESEVNPPEHVSDYLAQVVESPAVSPLVEDYETDFAEDVPPSQEYEDNVFLPTAPISPPQSFTRSPPPVPLQNPVERTMAPTEQPPQRQPRLVRVGRIPPIMPRNERQDERQHRPSRASFSQPFARTAPAEDSYAASRTQDAFPLVPLHINTDVLPSRPFVEIGTVPPASAPLLGDSEFLRFPSRQASDVSTSSSSAGILSILGAALAPGAPENGLTGRGGLRPNAYLPGSPSIDEVWNEYDDFIDHVMSPSRTRKSMKTPWNPTDQDIERSGGDAQFLMQDPYPSTGYSDPILSEFPVPAMKRPVLAGAPATSATPPVVFAPPTVPERPVGEDIRLRRSRIVSALHSPKDLASPFSIRDLISEYQDNPRSSRKMSDRLSTSTAGGSLERLTTTSSAPDVHPDSTHQQNVAMLEVVERGKDPVAQNELHYASLMVAKWLSFGRVLFSPAHDEVHTFPERHILVIDGLGNEDWSIYCAVNYEGQRAFVHNLKEKPTTKGKRSSKPSQHSPENHRRAEVASFHERFPFPPGFFSVVVLRFPPAMAEAKMKNIVSECRRVLMPGGYLELMLLDLDIVNMGVQTRRAVRELKFKMTTADKQISLRPIIDNVQSVLGSRGFTNISRCVVGVPVAGRPSGSMDSSSSSRSSGGSEGHAKRASGDARPADASPRMTFGQGHRGANLSLNDLLSDRSDNADLRIGKIVSRTARTWWQHCFEATVISNGNLAGSIFADKNVLGECKARGSSFKMLIAYAQRPVFETRRRTMSEPVVSTLATAGQKMLQPSTGNPRTA